MSFDYFLWGLKSFPPATNQFVKHFPAENFDVQNTKCKHDFIFGVVWNLSRKWDQNSPSLLPNLPFISWEEGDLYGTSALS